MTRLQKGNTFDIIEQMLKTNERIAVLDDFKGFMLFFYIFVQVMMLPKTFATPEWFAHSRIGGKTLPFVSMSISDFGPALFYFVIGMAAGFAFRGRASRFGRRSACRHYIYRNLAVVGIAAVAQFAGNALSGSSYDWNALSSVGLVGVLLFPFLEKGTVFRLVSACILLAWYQIFRAELFGLLGGNEGGIAACAAYLALALLASVLSDLLKKDLMLFGWGVAAVGAAATAMSFLLKPVFREYNASYVVMSLFVISLIFYGFAVVNSFVKRNIPYVNAVGKNLLFFFVLTYASTFIARQLISAPLTLVGCILLSCIIFAVYCFVAGLLERKNIIIKL